MGTQVRRAGLSFWTNRTAHTLIAAAGACAISGAASAGIVIPPGSAVRTWTGNLSNDWHSAANWTPAVVPIGGDSAIILDADANIFLTNTTNNLASLYVGMNRSLSTNGHALRVYHAPTTGMTTINGVDSSVFVAASGFGGFQFDTNTLDIENDGRLQLSGGNALVRQQLTADTGGRVVGYGLLRTTSPNPAALNLFDAGPLNVSGGDMEIQVFSGGSFAPPQTIQVMQANRSLVVDAPLFTPVRDLILGPGCSVEFEQAWTVEGEITAQPGAGNEALIVDSGPLTLEGELTVSSGELVVATEIDLAIGSSVNVGTNIFESRVLRFSAPVDSFPGSDLSVGFNSTIVFDGPIPALWQGEINSTGGVIEANVPAGFWTVDAPMNLGSFAGQRTQLNGTAATRVTGSINATGTGIAANAPLIILPFSTMHLNSESTELRVNNLLALHSSSDTTGLGRIVVGEGATMSIGTSADVEVDVDNAGTVHAGLASPQVGYAYITGDYTQDDTGTLMVDLGGLTPLLHDVYETSGDATFAGTLHITLANGFVPQVGDTFEVVQTNGSVIGAFDALAGEPGFEVSYTPNRVVLEFVGIAEPCGADLSGNGLIDSDDLTILLGAFGVSGDGDIDGDGDTDSDDLSILLGLFGSIC
ncbi:MAG: hypothetical protein ACTS3F_05325 [Phycisphaerales bacterium]